MSGIVCGGAHSVAYVKNGRPPPPPLLHDCENNKYGCKAAMLRGKIEMHTALCHFKRLTCPNMCRGCNRDDLVITSFDNHVASCRFREIECKCGVMITLKDLKEHTENICLAVDIKCELCGEMTTRGEFEGHLEVCPNFKVKCPACKIGVARHVLAEHGKRCSRRIVTCACGDKMPADMVRSCRRCKKAKEEEVVEGEKVVEEKVEKKVEKAEKPKLERKSSTAKRVGGGFNLVRK